MRPVKAVAYMLLLAFSAGLVSGCWDRRDPENVVWVTAIGVDKGPRQDYLFTFQMVIPRAVASQQGGQGPGAAGGQTFMVYTVEAADVISALNMTDSFIAREVSIQHAKAVILGEEVAREGTRRVLGAAVRYVNFRRSMFMMVARGTAREFLNLVKPSLESNPAFWFELLVNWGVDANIIPETRVHSFVMEMEGSGIGARAIQGAARPDIESGEAEALLEKGGGEPPNAVEQNAGRTRRTGGAPVDVIGTGIFRGDQLRGFLTGNETRLLAVLRGELKEPHWSFVDPLDSRARVLVIMRAQSSPRLRVQIRNGQVFATWQIQVEGDLASLQSDADYTQPKELRILEQAIERNLEKEMVKLLDKVLHEWEVDVFHIANTLRAQFATHQQWEQFDWPRRIPQTKAAVQVSFRVRRHGLQTSPATPRQ